MKENKGSIKKIWPQSLFRFDGLSKWRNSGAQMKAIQSANLSLCNKSSRASRMAVALLAFFTIGSLFAQGAPGTIQGRILDSGTGEPMIGVTAFIREANVFGVTDIDGNYVIPDVPPGQHTVVFQMAGYESSQEVINMAAGGFEELNITMSYKTAKEVVVKAKRVNNTTAALLNKRKKAAAAQDAISSEQISKSPDSDAGDAAKRVTGVTIVGDKIFVRGLSERYTSVVLNGNAVPSTDPDNRFVPLDIFPVGIIDNLVISKSYTADKPAEFGGGALEIAIKQFPEEEILKVSIGSGYHDLTTFQNFRTYNGGNLDFFGIDDGFRSLPDGLRSFDRSADNVNTNTLNSNNYTASEIEAVGESVNKYYSPQNGNGIPPLSIGIDYGNSYRLDTGQKLGFATTLGFSQSSTTTRKDVFYPLGNGNAALSYNQEISKYSTSKTALIAGTFNATPNSQYSLTTFLSNRSTDEVSLQKNGTNYNAGDPYAFEQNSFSYANDTILFTQLGGKFAFQEALVEQVNAKLAFSRAARTSPDQRSAKSRDGGIFTSAIDQNHRWQENDDNIYDGQLAAVIPFKQWSGLKSKLELGGGANYRNRFSTQRWFRWNGVFSGSSSSLESLITNENISGSSNSGIYLEEMTRDYDMYKGQLFVANGYGQVDIPLAFKLRGVFGVRYEFADMNIIAYNPTQSKEMDIGIEPIERNNILPSANLIYAANANSNVRLSYSRTISRPDFREATPFQYIIFTTMETAVGNENLEQTTIDNADLRYEIFPSASSIIALTGFYKNLSKPVEVVELPGATRVLTYANATSAVNYGIELELRGEVDQLSTESLKTALLANFTYIASDINLNDGVNITGSNVVYSSSSRRLQGQSPYLANVGIDLDIVPLSMTHSVLYNHIGPKIVRVGITTGTNIFGDVTQQDYGKLDYVMKWQLFDKGTLKVSASNILDPRIETTQQVSDSSTNLDTTIKREVVRYGRKFGVGYSQKF